MKLFAAQKTASELHIEGPEREISKKIAHYSLID
jgi:hypothetical protein